MGKGRRESWSHVHQRADRRLSGGCGPTSCAPRRCAWLATETRISRWSFRTGPASIQGCALPPRASRDGDPAGAAVDVQDGHQLSGCQRVSVEVCARSSVGPRGLRGERTRSCDELISRVRADLARASRDPGLRRTLRPVFADEFFLASFRTCPASQSYHHAYIGGLLEHTVAVASLCDELAPRYDGVDATCWSPLRFFTTSAR